MSLISKITIELSDGSNITLSRYQALELYNELDQYFGGIRKEYYPIYPVYPVYPNYKPYQPYLISTSDEILPFVRDNTN